MHQLVGIAQICALASNGHSGLGERTLKIGDGDS